MSQTVNSEMNKADDIYLTDYQRLISEKSTEPCQLAEVKRKCLALSLHHSYISLDNQSICNLLEHNLEDYTSTVYPDGTNIYDPLVKRRINEMQIPDMNNTCSSLSKTPLSALTEPLWCAKNEFYCIKSENTSSVDFEEFLQMWGDKQQTTNQTTQSRQRKIAKSFAPHTCGIRNAQNGSKFGYGKAIPDFRDPEEKENSTQVDFRTAKDELFMQNAKKNGANSGQGVQKRKLGMMRRTVSSKFVSPLLSNNESNECRDSSPDSESMIDERLKNIEPRMVELIRSEIMDNLPTVSWDDIAGLDFAKTAIQEAVLWPMLRPDIFTGLRKPPKGILLFGPPGTGKTLIGKCVASQSKSTFFSISASSLTSKWIGEGEKMVRALFSVARCHQPAVIFIDEVDSLLTQRSDTEHESSRRLKTEFLVQLDGACTDNEERILLIGATNRPQELDEAARRRFVKRLYIPLPDTQARSELIKKLMEKEKQSLTEADISEIGVMSEGYSGADIKSLCSEASLGPIRSLDISLIQDIKATDVRPVNRDDFHDAFKRVKSSVSPADLRQYVIWDNTYGSGKAF